MSHTPANSRRTKLSINIDLFLIRPAVLVFLTKVSVKLILRSFWSILKLFDLKKGSDKVLRKSRPYKLR